MTPTLLRPCFREYVFEKRVEYRATVLGSKSCQEVDVCTHKHRTIPAALRCARRMIRAIEEKGKPQ